MARPCILCEHARRREIENAIIAGQSLRSLSAQYGIAYGAIHRHRHNHLPAAIRQAAQQAVQRTDIAQTATDTMIAPAPVCEAVEAVPAPIRTRQRTRGIQLSDSPPTPPVSPPVTAGQVDRATPAAGDVFNLYASATDLRERAMAILATAERDRDAKTALLAIREARGVLDHLSRLEERQGGNAATVPLVDSPEWHRTRAAIISALAAHPEARIAVAEALIATGALH